jgi:type IV secretory pathway TrbF-like protein
MNERVNVFFKISRFWLIAGVILFVWAIGATGIAVYFGRSYKSLQSSIATAGKGELLTATIERQRDTITTIQGDLGAAAGHIRDADRDARATDDAIRRAYELAKSSDDRFIEFGNSMDGVGGTIQTIIARQQRIDELIRASQADNRAIKVELGMCLGEDN